MGTQTTALTSFLKELCRHHRVIVLGDLGVIGHGLARSTKDADIWLDPLTSPQHWADALLNTVSQFHGLTIHGLPAWYTVKPHDLPTVIDEVGVVRINGLSCPLDIFRRPNNMEESDFEIAFRYSTPYEDGTFLMSALDLIVTKEETGRDRDRSDILFLEAKVRRDMSAALLTANPEQADALFDRYIDHAVLIAALSNPHETVRTRARALLQDLAASGDPFARDALS